MVFTSEQGLAAPFNQHDTNATLNHSSRTFCWRKWGKIRHARRLAIAKPGKLYPENFNVSSFYFDIKNGRRILAGRLIRVLRPVPHPSPRTSCIKVWIKYDRESPSRVSRLKVSHKFLNFGHFWLFFALYSKQIWQFFCFWQKKFLRFRMRVLSIS